MIVRPGVGGMHPAALLCVANVVVYAFYAIITRKLAAYDSTATTMFYTGLAGLALMAPLLPWIWTSPASLTHWALLFGVALFGTLGHWLLVMAHARAPANVLAPFIYTQLLWSVTLGFLLLVNIFWSVLNLVPVLPLDGGQIAREILIWLNPHRGQQRAMLISAVAGAGSAYAGYVYGQTFLAILFGLFAYQNFAGWQTTRSGGWQ